MTTVSKPATVFPVQVSEGFQPKSIEHSRWDGRPCPCQKSPFKPAWGGGFREKRGAHDHDAVDIMAAEGTPILAPCDGVIPVTHRIKMDGVLKAHPGVGTGVKAGHYFFLTSVDGHWMWYGSHLMEFCLFKPGDQVKAGEVLGYVGATGNAKSKNGRGCPHLHLSLTALTKEARASSRAAKIDTKTSGKVDPVPYLKPIEPK